MSLIARELEARNIPTMILGSALDILQAGRPPRATVLDYPLGHSGGRPGDFEEQLAVVRAALQGLESMREPESIRHLDYTWSDDDTWRHAATAASKGDSRQPRDETPQWQFEADRLLAQATGGAAD